MANWTEPLPWQLSVWHRLDQARSALRLPHALIICGPAGLGKRHFARALTARLLCHGKDDASIACGVCKSCVLMRSGAHPDFLDVTVEEGRTAIRVQQIRRLTGFLDLTSSLGPNKAALVESAQRMNENAANSLLKTLEEPPSGSYLVLVTETPARLPATIRSRCQLVRLPKADAAEALAWLAGNGSPAQARLAVELSRGAPLVARELLAGGYLQQRQARLAEFLDLARGRADPLPIAAAWAKEGAAEILAMVNDWLEDLLRLAITGDAGLLRNPDLARDLQEVVAGMRAATLFTVLDRAREARRLCDTTVTPQLLLEGLLVKWYRCASGGVEG